MMLHIFLAASKSINLNLINLNILQNSENMCCDRV